MAGADFEFLITLISLKTVKDTVHRAAVPVEKRQSVTMQFSAIGNLYTTLQ
jgi:hypothetical protein